MYKLSGHSLTKGMWFNPESQGMSLSERASTTSITLGPDDPEISFDEWLLDTRWPEGNYVWRVKSLGDQTNTETRTIDLEHVIKILDDIKLFGEVTTEDLAGQSGATTVTAKKAVQYILSKCSDWTLGDFDYDEVSNPYEFNGDSLYDALETITETLEDAVWSYNLSVYPFKLNITTESDTVACEMRAGRNLSTLKRQVSRSGMYTRIYPIGKNDLHIDGEYLSKNENLYGRIDQIETDQSKSTKANLQAWAQGRLNRHCEPEMTISISGLELSADTGEDLDRLKLNRKCRCPLPNSSTVICEKIVKLQWRDRIKEPENVTVNLCNNSADVATIIRQQNRSSGRSARGQARQNYLFEANGEHLYYEIFDDCGHLHGMLEMNSESLRIAFDNEIASARSEFLMTSESLRIAFESEIGSARSEFQMSVESIRLYVGSAEAAAEIVAQINASTGESEIKLDAQKVYIGNDKSTTVIAGKCALSDVTANYISGKIAELSVLSVAAISATGNIHTSNGYIAAPYYYIGSGSSLQNMASGIWALQITSSGNTYTLQKKDWDDSGWVDVGSFSRAVASWTMGWSSGIFTATANPQSQSASTTITQGTPSWDGTDVTIPIMGEDSDNPGYSYSTGRNVLVSVAGKLETKSVSGAYAGMTLIPGEGKIGFSSVTIGALTEYKISESWGTGNESNKLIISRDSTGSTSITHTITADASVSFNSSTNKFHATAKAKVDGTEKDNDSDDSGVISIALNSMQGSGASAYRTASVKNGSTAIVTSGNITDYGDGYTEGYNAGWNAACALISRSGNSIIGPVTGKATATSGRTETKYTANYTASKHSYTPSSYTAAKHSYTASTHSYTQAKCTTGTLEHTTDFTYSSYNGSVKFVQAKDSYTASKHSYTPASYTAESHSYTASSFSWS